MPGRSLRILCFGDSLTSGFCHFGLDSRPYSIRLKTRLVGALPHRHIEVFTSGVPGDVVANQPWENRLEAERGFSLLYLYLPSSILGRTVLI